MNNATSTLATTVGPGTTNKLTDTCNVRVSFNEVDSYHIVWHGHYIDYFERGRESFGRKYGISYDHISKKGVIAPIVRVEADYRHPLRYGDHVSVVTTYEQTATAKVCFKYRIESFDGKTTYCRGYSEQVMLNAETNQL